MANSITVYSKPNCVQCTATKKDLEKKGLAFDEVDITKDHDALMFVLGLGHQSAPVVVVGDDSWGGFQPAKIAALAAAQAA